MVEEARIRIRIDTIEARQQLERFARFQREAGVATPIEAKVGISMMDRLSGAGLTQAEISPLRVAAGLGARLISKSSEVLAARAKSVKGAQKGAPLGILKRVTGFVKKADVFLQVVQGGSAFLGEIANQLTKNNKFMNDLQREHFARSIDNAARIRSEAIGLSQTLKQSFTIAEGLAIAGIKATSGQGSRIGEGLMAMNTATAREQQEFQVARTRLYTRGALSGATLIANAAKGMAKNMAERTIADTRALVSELENTTIGKTVRKIIEDRNKAMMAAATGKS